MKRQIQVTIKTPWGPYSPLFYYSGLGVKNKTQARRKKDLGNRAKKAYAFIGLKA